MTTGHEGPQEPVRVLHLITDLDRGGAETALVRLVTRMDRARFRSAVISLKSPGPLAGELRARGVPVLSLAAEGRSVPRLVFEAARAVRSLRPDVLQTWLYHADLIGLLAGRAARVPAIGWNIRCAGLERTDHPRSLFLILRALSRFSSMPDVVIVNSLAGQRVHEALGYRPRRWELIPNGFDMQTFAPSDDGRRAVRAELRLSDQALVAGLVARFHPMKDHATFLSACGRVAAALPQAHFVLAGRLVDRENPRIRELAEQHGLATRVSLLGEIDDPLRLYQALDLAVLSSYSEAFPNVVGEAMACGVPVVTTDAGDAASIVGDAGWVVPCRDPRALASAMLEALRLPADLLRRRGLRGRERIGAEFSVERVVTRYEALYAEIANGRRRRH